MNYELRITNDSKMIGIAGPIAAGKNAVSDFFINKGFVEIDVDKIGHLALELQKEIIAKTFASEEKKHNVKILNDDGSVNRKNLAIIVFDSKKNLQMHESIMHPKMNELIEHEIAKNPESNYLINAAILHKFSVIKQCNFVLFVTANPFLRYKRAKSRNNIPFLQFFKTFLAQIEIYSKCKKLNADIYRVVNSKKREDLEEKLEKFYSTCL